MRASTVLGRIDYIKKHHSAAAVDRVLATMPPILASEIRGAVVPGNWVRFDAVMEFIEAIDKVLGRGDLGLVRPLARHAANVNMPLLYKIIYKLGSIDFILSKAAAVWGAHYDSGMATSQCSRGEVHVSIEGFATPHRIHCLTVQGWIEEIVSLCDAKIVESREAKCRLRRDRVCEFELKYTS